MSPCNANDFLGCLTCKIRHVKCDEQRPKPHPFISLRSTNSFPGPSCLRRSYLGKKCGGYQHLERPAASSSSHNSTRRLGSPCPDSPGQSLHGFLIHSPRERRAIEFFYHKAVPKFVLSKNRAHSTKIFNLPRFGNLLPAPMQFRHRQDVVRERETKIWKI
jgi:hypothetical protein